MALKSPDDIIREKERLQVVGEITTWLIEQKDEVPALLDKDVIELLSAAIRLKWGQLG